ncbi:hypothetical protein KC361_g65 [Hortaea werneckii]|nr:hypothetical protein KC361_g65 [Hortaea werneckii]
MIPSQVKGKGREEAMGYNSQQWEGQQLPIGKLSREEIALVNAIDSEACGPYRSLTYAKYSKQRCDISGPLTASWLTHQSAQQPPSKQPSAGRPKSQETTPKEDTKSPKQVPPRAPSSRPPTTTSLPPAPLLPPSARLSPKKRRLATTIEISAWEARGMPGSRKTSAELDREYSHLHQPTVPGPLDEAEFDSDEED